VKHATIALLLLLACAGAFAQTAPLSTDAAFNDLVAKNPTAPPVADVLDLYLASRAGGTQAVASTKADYVTAANNTRTDVQVGASPNTPGATSASEKTGFADLLSLAVERGAVNSQSNGTALTLSTTPYLLGGFVGVRDSPQNWRDYAALRHIALSASFTSGTSVDQGDFSSVDSGEVKWTVLGNRSPRDIALIDQFQPLIAPIQQRDQAKATACAPVTTMPNYTQQLVALQQFVTSAGSVTAGSLRAKLDTIVGPQLSVTAEQNTQLQVCAAAVALAQSTANAATLQMSTLTNAYLALNNKQQLSLAGSAHRDTTIDDYTSVKILYAYNSAPKLTVNLNAEGDFNQHYQHKNLHQVRAISVEGGATIGRFNDGRFDATLAAKWWRNADSNNKNVGVLQVNANLYITSSVSLPVALSWANHDEANVKKGFQINVGLASLLDNYLTQSLDKTP